ncbi:MAG: sulfotransferase [Pseudomonadota bacterium]
MQRPVDFFIVGAPKAGTTALHQFLAGHPGAYLSQPKELNYFSGPELKSQSLYYKQHIVESREDYTEVFDTAETLQKIGEASVSYLFYPEVAKRIRAYNPHAKIIILLRDPVDRAFSHYLMDYRMGLVDAPFEDIVFRASEQHELHYQQYVLLGLYHDQVKRYLDAFPDQVQIHFHKQLIRSPEQVMQSLYSFLDIDESYSPDLSERHNMSSMPRTRLVRSIYSLAPLRSAARTLLPSAIRKPLIAALFDSEHRPTIEPATDRMLRALYAEDIAKLELLLGKDLTDWKP